MKIYSIPNCPFCLRVKIALKLRKITDIHIEIEEIDLNNPPAAFLEISPNKTVPALELSQGNGFSESMLIIEYLDSLQGKGAKLYGETFVDNLKTKLQIQLVSEKVTSPLNNAVFTKGSLVKEKKALTNALIAFYDLEKLLNQNEMRFLGGDELNASDIHLIPFALFYCSAQKLRQKWSMPEAKSRVEKYFNDILHHSSVRKIMPSLEECTDIVNHFMKPSPDIEKIKNSSRSLVQNINENVIILNENISMKLKNNSTQIWHKNENSQGPFIETTFKFKNYDDALKAIQVICDLQETSNHHAHFILENFSQLKVEVCTHEPKWGVTAMDFAFAEVLTSQIYN